MAPIGLIGFFLNLRTRRLNSARMYTYKAPCLVYSSQLSLEEGNEIKIKNKNIIKKNYI
jgi:hypothetical protein